MRTVSTMFTAELYRSSDGEVLQAEMDRLIKISVDPKVIRIAVDSGFPDVKPVLYISGPMSGKPDNNYPMFRECAEVLRADGWKVVDPSEHFNGRTDLPRWKYLSRDVQALIQDCQGIVLLEGWRKSDGARLEAQIALDRGYDLYMWGWWGSGLRSVDRDALERSLSR